MSDMKKLVLAERLSARVILFLVIHKKSIEKVVVFGSTRWRFLTRGLKFARLIDVIPEYVKLHLADVKDEKGRCLFQNVYRDASKLCDEVRRHEFEKNPRIAGACRFLAVDPRAVFLYLEKSIYEDIFQMVTQIRIAQSILKTTLHSSHALGVLFLPDCIGWAYVLNDCARMRIQLVKAGWKRRSFVGARQIIWKNILPFLYSLGRSLPNLLRVLWHWVRAQPTKTSESSALKGDILVATEYLGTPAIMDLDKRSTFPWLINSGIPNERIAMIRWNDKFDLNQDERKFLKEKKVKLFEFSKQEKGLAVLRSLWDRKFLGWMLGWMWFALSCQGKKSKIHRYYAGRIILFAIFLRFWSSFFQRTRIRIFMTTAYCDPFHIAMSCALNQTNGICMSYQWSNFEFVSKHLSLCCDVYFGFSEFYKTFFDQNGSLIGNFIPTGYVTDYTINKVRDQAMEMKKTLCARGAKFIVCFFDENSSDDIYTILPNSTNTHVHAFILKRVLNDKTLGVIFKPSYPQTIYNRLAPISDLIDEAKKTGRCLFVDDGQFKSNKMPTEIAQSSDVAVGFLLSGTVALESCLSGVKTVFFNQLNTVSEGLGPEEQVNSVFGSMEDLFAAIERFRNSGDRSKKFGDITQWAKVRDNYQDGKATVRIGNYVNGLWEGLNSGKSREDVLSELERVCASK